MPVYRYRGVAAGNRSVRDTIDADSLRAARLKLRADGIYATEIAEGSTGTGLAELLSHLNLRALQRVPDLDLAMFTSQLSTLLAAGVPLLQSLAALTEQIENDRLQSVVGKVRESVNQGATLADAMAEFPHIFDQLYCSMVRAGEASGALDLVLRRLADYIENRMELRNKLINAMVYPALMLTASAIVAGVLLVKVIPTITSLLRDLDQELPFATLAVIGVSDFLTAFWPHLVLGLAGLYLLFNRATATQRGRLAWDHLKLRLPVIGRTVRYVAISRFARTLATLQQGGLNIVNALDIARRVAGNAVISQALDEAREALTRGAAFGTTLRRSGHFPSMVTHMVSVGEASGELPSMLARVADTYDQLVDNALRRLTALMGPILLILVAVLVVIILLSTLLPLLNLTSAL